MYAKLVVLAALFVALTPGVLLALPPGATLLTQAVVHSVVFVVAWTLVWKSGLLSKRR